MCVVVPLELAVERRADIRGLVHRHPAPQDRAKILMVIVEWTPAVEDGDFEVGGCFRFRHAGMMLSGVPLVQNSRCGFRLTNHRRNVGVVVFNREAIMDNTVKDLFEIGHDMYSYLNGNTEGVELNLLLDRWVETVLRHNDVITNAVSEISGPPEPHAA